MSSVGILKSPRDKEETIDAAQCNALVFFSITGDLAYKKIVPSLQAEEKDAYERVLGDATLLARQDYVEEAWRIVDPYLKSTTPVYEDEPNICGLRAVDQRVLPQGG